MKLQIKLIIGLYQPFGGSFFGEKIKFSLERLTLIIRAYHFDKQAELSIFYLGNDDAFWKLYLSYF
jgi:hypothetical protein